MAENQSSADKPFVITLTKEIEPADVASWLESIPIAALPPETPTAQRPTREAVTIRYANWRGETAWRVIQPERLWFGESPFHEGQQWFLDAIDLEREGLPRRSFALAGISRWQPWTGTKPADAVELG